MAANTTPIFPVVPVIGIASLATVSACTTRGPIAHASLGSTPCFAVQLIGTSTNGIRVDKIQVQADSTNISAPTASQTVLIWASDGTTAYVIDEITVSPVTPSTIAAAFSTFKIYSNLVLPSTWSLWTSTTVATTASTTAIAVQLFGGSY